MKDGMPETLAEAKRMIVALRAELADVSHVLAWHHGAPEERDRLRRYREALEHITERFATDDNIRPGSFAIWAAARAKEALEPDDPS